MPGAWIVEFLMIDSSLAARPRSPGQWTGSTSPCCFPKNFVGRVPSPGGAHSYIDGRKPLETVFMEQTF